MKLLSLKLPALSAILIITAGVVVRLININQPLLEFFPPRQTQTAEITRNIYVNGWPDFWTPKVRYFTPPQAGQAGEPIAYVLEFPLYNGLVAALYHLIGPNVIWGRVVSLISFVGSTLIFYRLLRTGPDFSPEKSAGTPEPRSHALRLRGRRPRAEVSVLWGSLLFFIFSPLHILVSRSFQPEELALFLLLLAVYKKSWLIFSLAVLTKLPLAFFAPAVFFYPSLRGASATCLPAGRRGNLNNIVKCGLSLIPSILWYWRASKLTIHPAIARNFDISNWFQPHLWLNPKWYFSMFQIEHIWVLTTLGLLFFWLGFWQIVAIRRLLAVIIASLRGSPKASRGNPVLWLFWLINGLLYLAIFNYHAMTHEYYHLFLLPPLSAIAGLGIASTLSNVSKHWSKFIFSAGIILMVIGSMSLPAIKKIISAPKSPQESTEITPARYRLIEDF